MTEFGALSVLPPVLALGLAIKTRQVYVSLFVGIWLGWTIMSGWNPIVGFAQSVEALVGVFADRGQTLILLLTALIGALLTFTQYSGGTRGFMEWVSRRGFATTPRAAGVMAWLIGFVIFVEANIGVFVSGPVSRPLFDRLRVSREKLAYILDSTAAAKATILPVNSWGAYIIGLIAAQEIENPLRTMVMAIPMNLYALLAIGLALAVVVTQWDIGPMRRAERRVRDEGKILRDGARPLVSSDVLMLEPKPDVPARAINMILPVLAIIVSVLIALIMTGDGNMMNGDGSLSVFWAVAVALLLAGVSYGAQRIMTLGEVTDMFMRGVGGMVPIMVLLMLAFVMGDTCRALGTGPFVAGAAEAGVPRGVIPAALFLVGAATSFSTGTSWGTWAIMFPVAMPMVEVIGLPTGLVIGAVLGGGIFGDHCSPISDSTIISSMAAGTDHIDHVRTQLPYALMAAAVTVAAYLVLGFTL
ncbi:MAG: sodium:solute symporter [Acidobacteria bacterium]|nr:sodium:solute symporter [Acidobacteriota bacterium]|tara:strand:+ start:1790 stop:3205 length:1416 start_codon:yes stop_codon:yes gene_type:complete